MSKILLSIPDELLKDMDSYCAKLSYERSEFVRMLVRNVLYPLAIPPNDIPVITTMEGNPVFKEDVPHNGTPALVPIPDLPRIREEDTSPIIQGWCQTNAAHPLLRNQNFPIRKITWEDEEGRPIVSEKWACPKCVEHYQNLGRGRVFFL